MASFRAGVAGAGSISRRHISAWQAHPDVDLTCIADISEQAANSRADEFGIRNRYTSLIDMFSEEYIEILSICTWMNAHADIAVAASEAGIAAILCENRWPAAWRKWTASSTPRKETERALPWATITGSAAPA